MQAAEETGAGLVVQTGIQDGQSSGEKNDQISAGNRNHEVKLEFKLLGARLYHEVLTRNWRRMRRGRGLQNGRQVWVIGWRWVPHVRRLPDRGESGSRSAQPGNKQTYSGNKRP